MSVSPTSKCVHYHFGSLQTCGHATTFTVSKECKSSLWSPWHFGEVQPRGGSNGFFLEERIPIGAVAHQIHSRVMAQFSSTARSPLMCVMVLSLSVGASPCHAKLYTSFSSSRHSCPPANPSRFEVRTACERAHTEQRSRHPAQA